MEFIQDFAWIFWLALILVFVIIEVTTVDFTFLMLAVGSLGGLIVGLFGVPWWVQIIVAGILSILLLFTVRPPLLRLLKRGGDHTKSNVEALSGLTGIVTIDFVGTAGTVKLANGETWTAKLGHAPTAESIPLVAGDHVFVTSIEGATAIVSPAERNTNG
jgi:membrane protein implicated in regulation of membrane protease activity